MSGLYYHISSVVINNYLSLAFPPPPSMIEMPFRHGGSYDEATEVGD